MMHQNRRSVGEERQKENRARNLSELLRLASRNALTKLSLEEFLASNASIDGTNLEGHTLLHYMASWKGNVELLEMLVVHGANVDAQNASGYSPLHMAVAHSNVAAVEVLLASNANLDLKTNAGRTALELATNAQIASLIEIARDHPQFGMEIKGRDEALVRSQSKQFVENARLKKLTVAHVKELQPLILLKQIDVNAKDWVGCTALHYAVRHNNSLLLRCLLDVGAYVNMRSNSGQTPLHEAAFRGHLNQLKMLLAAEADVTIVNNSDSTALHRAAISGHADCAKALLEAGTDVNTRDKHGKTALEDAKAFQHYDVVNVLRLNRGQERNPPAQQGRDQKHRQRDHDERQVIQLRVARDQLRAQVHVVSEANQLLDKEKALADARRQQVAAERKIRENQRLQRIANAARLADLANVAEVKLIELTYETTRLREAADEAARLAGELEEQTSKEREEQPQPPLVVSTPPPDQVEMKECVVCEDAERDHVIVPCGHLVICKNCAPAITQLGSCPVCRQDTTTIIQVYM